MEVPEPAFDIGKGCVVAIPEGCSRSVAAVLNLVNLVSGDNAAEYCRLPVIIGAPILNGCASGRDDIATDLLQRDGVAGLGGANRDSPEGYDRER